MIKLTKDRLYVRTTSDLVKVAQGKGKNLEAEMSFFDHMEALRWHLIRSGIAMCIFTGIVFAYYDPLFDRIIMGPKQADFWTYRMSCALWTMLHKENFCIGTIPGKLINTTMAGQFAFQVNASLLIGLIMAFPYLLFELWRFIRPGLRKQERSLANKLVLYASLLFIMGILFGYFIVTPLSISFLANYQVNPQIENAFTINSYFASVATLTLATGLVFELPMVIYLLASFDLVHAKLLSEKRRHALVLILIAAAIITPTPDALTMLVVSIPLFVLYEISIIIAGKFDRIHKG